MSYETIKANDQVIYLGDETWSNKLLDFTTGNGITIIIEGDTTVKNVGGKGLYTGGSFVFSITSSGTVEFDTVYLGDGATKEGEDFVHGPGAVFLHKHANADVTFRRCNVQGFPNNAFYCSNTATGGSAQWYNCYGKNNGVSTFRCAGGDDAIIDCVAYNDDTDYGPGWGGYIEDIGRPVWIWGGGNVSIEDSHFAAGGYSAAVLTHQGGHGTMRGGAVSGGVHGGVTQYEVGTNPDLSVPAGCPTSAEAAAQGDDLAPPEEDDTDGYGEGGYGGNYGGGDKNDGDSGRDEAPDEKGVLERLEERVTELEEENGMLKDQLEEYDNAIENVEKALENAENHNPTFGSFFDAVRDRLP